MADHGIVPDMRDKQICEAGTSNGITQVEGSLPANFTSPQKSSKSSQESNASARKRPKPAPKPKVPGPKARKVSPGVIKPPLPKKPALAAVPVVKKKSPPLAAFRSNAVDTSEDIPDRPRVFEAFVTRSEDRPADNAPNIKHFPAITRRTSLPPQRALAASRNLHGPSTPELSSPTRNVVLPTTPVRHTSPESPSGRESPGILTRQGAIRAKRGERLSLSNSLPRSPQSKTFSPMADMRGVHGSFAYGENGVWTSDESVTNSTSPQKRGSLDRDSALSPTSVSHHLNVKPLLSERVSSMAQGSPGRSRSPSPRREAVTQDDREMMSLSAELLSPRPRIDPAMLSGNVADVSPSRVTYVPSPSSHTAPYTPSATAGQGSVDSESGRGDHTDDAERDLEHIRSRAASLARKTVLTDYYPVATPVKESSRKAFSEAFVKFSNGFKQEDAPVPAKRLSHSASATTVAEGTFSGMAAQSAMRRQVSHDNLMDESQEKVKQLVERYGGATGQRKPPVQAPCSRNMPGRQSAPSKVNWASNPSVASTATSTPTSSAETSVDMSSTASTNVHGSEQAEPVKKPATVGLSKRFSFRGLASRVSPSISRKQEKTPSASQLKADVKTEAAGSGSRIAGHQAVRSGNSTHSSLTGASNAGPGPTAPKPGRAVSLTNERSQPELLSVNHAQKPRAVSTPEVASTAPDTQQVAYYPNVFSRTGSSEPTSAGTTTTAGVSEQKRGEIRRNRYNSVKELTAAALTTPSASDSAPLSSGNSAIPLVATPSPDLESSQTSSSNGTPSSSDALSPEHSKSSLHHGFQDAMAPPDGTDPGLNDHGQQCNNITRSSAVITSAPPTAFTRQRYDDVEVMEGKPALAASDSGYSTTQEPGAHATAAAASLLPVVDVVKQLSEAADPIYDDVPMDGGDTTDDDLERSADHVDDVYEDVIYDTVTTSAPKPVLAMTESISLNTTSARQRLLWQDLDMVKDSDLLENLSPAEVKHQEAMFEVLSTEESYNKSLHVVLDHFMPYIVPSATGVASASGQTDAPTIFIEKSEHHRLFSNIAALVKISDCFLQELRSRLVEQVVFDTIADIVLKHVTKHFHPYVTYCTNQTYQLQAAKKLIDNPILKKALKHLEEYSGQKLPFSTYLLQPMQRITRLPLLIVTILDYLPEDSPHSVLTQQALQEVQLFVAQCNEGARSMERMEELIVLQKKVKFDSKTKPVAFVSQKRYLKRSGEVFQISSNAGKKGWTKNSDKHKVTLFLFNDMVIIAKFKKKQEQQYQVIDYTSCQLALLEECPASQLPTKVVEAEKRRASSLLSATPDGLNVSNEGSPQRSATPNQDDGSVPTAFKLVFLENWNGKNKEYVLMTSSLTEKTRWLNAFRDEDEPSETDGKKSIVYEMWNCPQHHVLFNYIPQQADELALQAGDVVKVLRKMEDDWCHGELMRDGTRGWFPIQFTEEIKSEDMRAENLRQRGLLLAEARKNSEQLVDL